MVSQSASLTWLHSSDHRLIRKGKKVVFICPISEICWYFHVILCLVSAKLSSRFNHSFVSRTRCAYRFSKVWRCQIQKGYALRTPRANGTKANQVKDKMTWKYLQVTENKSILTPCNLLKITKSCLLQACVMARMAEYNPCTLVCRMVFSDARLVKYTKGNFR